MRILHVIPSIAPRYGGPSKVCFEMARAVARRGHDVSIYTTDIDGNGRLPVSLKKPVRRDGVKIVHFPVQFPVFWRFSLPMARALGKTVRNFDVVHIHYLYYFPGVAAAHYCRARGVPYLLRPLGTLVPYIVRRHRFRKYPLELLFERRNLRAAGAIHFTAEEEFRLSRPHMFGGRGIVVPNGVYSEDYSRLPPGGAFRSRYPEMRGKRVILYLGRISYKKGLDLLLDAFAAIVARRRDLHLAIVGPDDEGLAAGLKRKADLAGLAGRVTFTGMLLGRRKLEAFRDAELFVLPSHYENFGVAVVEAMACRVPVLLSNRVDIWREVVRAGAGTVMPLDARALGRAMARMLDRPADLRRMGRRGRELARRKYDWKVVARRLEEVYMELREKGKCGTRGGGRG